MSEIRKGDTRKSDRIVPDWLGWLALVVALALAGLVAYFKIG